MSIGLYRPTHAAPTTNAAVAVRVVGALVLVGATLLIVLLHNTNPAGPHAPRRRPPPPQIVLIRSQP